MPEFLNYYGKLFEQSKIMEKILPRQVNNKELKEHFPFLFTDYNLKQFETADVVGVNKVRFINSMIVLTRGYLIPCMI